MPRLPNSLILRARNISPLLPIVLQGTRTLESAINELRWLREHVKASPNPPVCPRHARRWLLKLCKLRASGKPLQYILGSQPFGELDIKCRPGVLIPRPETEAYTTHLAELIKIRKLPLASFLRGEFKSQWPVLNLKILDICSGSGCISLLLYHSLCQHFHHLEIHGLDISKDAVALANENWKMNLDLGQFRRPRGVGVETISSSVHTKRCEKPVSPPPKFHVGNFLEGSIGKDFQQSHIIMFNPPYISPTHFNTETTRSVRNWEPKLALVPPQLVSLESLPYDSLHGWEGDFFRGPYAPEDIFYFRMLWSAVYASFLRTNLILMEVGDENQAIRVVEMTFQLLRVPNRPSLIGKFRGLDRVPNEVSGIEIWRDWPDQSPEDGEEDSLEINGGKITVKGSGKMRAVLVFLRNS